MARHPTLGILTPIACILLFVAPETPTRVARQDGLRAAAGPALQEALPQEVPPQEVPPQEEVRLESPEDCQECHPLVYDRWNRGMHRLSFEDPVFQVSYAQVYLKTGGKAAPACLRCHAPLAYAAEDWDVSDRTHQQGVQCGFCHSVESVDAPGIGSPFHLRTDKVFGSPHADVRQTKAHGTSHQPLLRSSSLCAGCHEYVVDGGARLISTWSEWNSSPYAEEGKTCQSCHMPTVQRVVSEDGKVLEINDHDLSGGHSSQQIRKAGRVTISSVTRSSGFATVEAVVENVGSGHCLPTGIPSRRLVLSVEAVAGTRVLDSDFRVYRKVVGDESGCELDSDAEIKWAGRTIISDNRLLPREARTETFRLRVPEGIDCDIRAILTYSYSPMLLKPENIRIRMAADRKAVPGDR